MNYHTVRSLRTVPLLRSRADIVPSTLLIQRRNYASPPASSPPPTPPNVKAEELLNPKSQNVNPPLTTLPPPLDLPERKPDESQIKYLFHVGKAFVNFYKTGAKGIWQNHQLSRQVHHVLRTKYDSSWRKSIESGVADRAVFQLVHRHAFDIKRVPAFAVLFIICGEFTPLVVMAITDIVPYPCRIPKQIEQDRKVLEGRRRISFRNLTSPLPGDRDGAEELNRMQLLHTSWSLGLSAKAWDWIGGSLPGPPTFLLRRRVARRLEYLSTDDMLIESAGGVSKMSDLEVARALVERGVDVLAKEPSRQRELLRCWIQSAQKSSIVRLLLTRPNQWPVQPRPETAVPNKLSGPKRP